MVEVGHQLHAGMGMEGPSRLCADNCSSKRRLAPGCAHQREYQVWNAAVGCYRCVRTLQGGSRVTRWQDEIMVLRCISLTGQVHKELAKSGFLRSLNWKRFRNQRHGLTHPAAKNRLLVTD